MKIIRIIGLLVMVIIMSPLVMVSQEIDISGEIRPRFEFRNGYKMLMPDGADPASFISQRTRLNGYYANTQFKAKLVLQDVRVWGDVPQLNMGDVYGTAIHEAWGELFLTGKLSIKVGRQEISYDDQRIFGSVGWAQQARSHDAALIKYNPTKDHRIDIGVAYNNNGETLFKTDYTVNSYKTFQYLWYHGKFGNAGLSFLVLNNGMAYMDNTPTDTTQKIAYSQTIGPRVTYKGEKFNTNAAFYYQMGKNKSNRDLNAMYISANFNFSLTDNFGIGVGGEYLSGTATQNQANSSEKDKSFKPFYGTNHKFNGWMDYFYVGSYMNSNGLTDIYLPITYTYNKFTFKLVPHYFMAAATVSQKQSDGSWVDYKSNLGTEIDFTGSYAVSKAMVISAGYSQMFATETMQVLKGGNYKNANNWAWVMITFKPTFFSSK